MNVSDTFKEFLQNLAIPNREKISYRYGEITKVLNNKYRNTDSTTSNSLQVGSYGRFTAIKSISDLDMVYILPWTTYERFKNGRQSALLQEVKTTIQTRYPKTNMRGDGQVVVISFTNYQIEVSPIHFFLAGYIESWGRGIEKIIEESQKFNGITPQFRWENGLWVEFYFNNTSNKKENTETRVKTREKILEIISTNPNTTNQELADTLELTVKGIEWQIKKLKEENKLQRIGGAKGGYWEILK
jgi:hypothetical protein